ncbi:MAG: DUF58 domain-containing protein [Pseudomonadota bacterium]
MSASAPYDIADLRRAAAVASDGFDALLLDAERLARTVAAGAHGRRRPGPGETFWQHRPYAFGDPAATIDWRQSARGAGRLFVRQTEWEAAATAWIWSDPSASMEYASDDRFETKRRRADTLAVALTMLLARGGERIGLCGGVGGGQERPFHGRGAAERFLEAIAARGDTDTTIPTPQHVAPGAAATLIGDFYTDPAEVERAVESFAAEGAYGCIVHVADPAEIEFPFAGRTEFQDLESPARLTFGDAAAVAADYRAAFAAHRARLGELCDSLGWTFVAHATDEPATTALLSVYVALSDGARAA